MENLDRGDFIRALKYIADEVRLSHAALPEGLPARYLVARLANGIDTMRENLDGKDAIQIDRALRVLRREFGSLFVPERHPSGNRLKVLRSQFRALGEYYSTTDMFGEDSHYDVGATRFDSDVLSELFLCIVESAQQIAADIEIKRTQLPSKLRFSILERDNFRCQICGRDATDRVLLEIDHKIPVSKGGSNDVGNLQVLCRECNIGKSDSLM